MAARQRPLRDVAPDRPAPRAPRRRADPCAEPRDPAGQGGAAGGDRARHRVPADAPRDDTTRSSASTRARSSSCASTPISSSPRRSSRGASFCARGSRPTASRSRTSGPTHPYARADAEIDATIDRVEVRSPFILTVGTVEPRKDLPTIIEAVDRVRRAHPALSLVIVGPPGWGGGQPQARAGVQGARPAAVVGRRRVVPARNRVLRRVAL